MDYRQESSYRDEPRDYGYPSHRLPIAEAPVEGGYMVDHGPRADDRSRPESVHIDDRRYSSQRDGPRERESSHRLRSEDETGPSRHLWVGNVTADITDELLVERFGKYGDVESASVYGVRNYAFVNFRNVEDAAAAKRALQGASFKGGLPIRIEFAKGGQARPSRHLWVGGISPDVSKQHLESEFQRYGRLEDFRYVRDRNCAHADFAQQEDAVAAVEGLNGKVIGGEALRVEYGRTPYRGSAKDGRGSGFDERDRPGRDHGIGSPDGGRRRDSDSFRDSRGPSDGYRGHGSSDSHQGSGAGAKEGDPSEVLWVGFPLWVKVDDDILHEEFRPFGEIARIKTFPGRTYAFVQFVRMEDAARAKDELEGKLFDDPRVHIKFSKTIGPGPADGGRDEGGYRDAHPRGRAPYPEDEHRYGAPSISYRSFTSPDRIGPRRDMDPPLRGGGARHVGPRRGPDGRPMEEPDYYDGGRGGPRPLPGSSLPPGRGAIRPAYDDWGNPPLQDEDGLGPRDAKRARYGPGYESRYDDGLPYLSEGGRDGYEPGVDRGGYPMSSIPPRAAVGPGGAPLQELGLSGGPQPGRAPAGPLVGMGSQVPPTAGGAGLYNGAAERPPPETAPAPWVGSLAKGGTLICRARAYAIGKGIDNAIPEVINCTARTDLAVLAKHIYAAKDFGVVALVPAESADIPPYEDFVQYLGEKRRAGVAKLLDGSTLFLVPPSDFSQTVLKVPRKDALFGVALTSGQPPTAPQPGPAQQAPPSQSQLLPAAQTPSSQGPPLAETQAAPLAPAAAPVTETAGAQYYSRAPVPSPTHAPQQTPPPQVPASTSLPAPPGSQAFPQALTAEALASLTALLPQSSGQGLRPAGPPAGGLQPSGQSQQQQLPHMQPAQGQPPQRPDARPALVGGPVPPLPPRPLGPGQYPPQLQQQQPQQQVAPSWQQATQDAGPPTSQWPYQPQPQQQQPPLQQQQQQQPSQQAPQQPPPQQPPQLQQQQQQYMQPPMQMPQLQQVPQPPPGPPSQPGPLAIQSAPPGPGGPFQPQASNAGQQQAGAIQNPAQPGAYAAPGQPPLRPPLASSSPQLSSDQLAQLTAMLTQRQLPPAQKQPQQPQQQQQQQQPPQVQQGSVYPPQQYPGQMAPMQQQQPQQPQYQQQGPPQQQQQPPQVQGQQWPPLPSQALPQSFPPHQVPYGQPQPQQGFPALQQQQQQQYPQMQQQHHAQQPQPVGGGQPQGGMAQWEAPVAAPQMAGPPQQQQQLPPATSGAESGAQGQQGQGDAEAKRFQATLQLAAALLQQMQQQQQQGKTS